MPTYDYQCPKCGELIVDVKIAIKDLDKAVVLCSKCKTIAERKINTPQVILKGSCWSKDGYERRGEKPRGE